jgi:hypothetical protein
MPNFNLLDVSGVIASYGRGVMFYAPKWTPLLAPPLVMTQLGVTEGDIVITPNSTTAALTMPELTGPAAHEVDYVGENPVIEVPLYLADPALLAIVSPSGSAHGGRSRRSGIKEYTFAVFPEALFLEDDVDGIPQQRTVAYDAATGAWTFNAVALTPERVDMLAASFWLWRGAFNRPPRRFRGGAGDDKKNIETVSIQSIHHPDMPEGHHLYTTGDPFDSAIDLNGTTGP